MDGLVALASATLRPADDAALDAGRSQGAPYAHVRLRGAPRRAGGRPRAGHRASAAAQHRRARRRARRQPDPRSRARSRAGVAQGIGIALMEDYVPGRSENLHDYLIPTIGDVPGGRHASWSSPAEHRSAPTARRGSASTALVPTALRPSSNAIRDAVGAPVQTGPRHPAPRPRGDRREGATAVTRARDRHRPVCDACPIRCVRSRPGRTGIVRPLRQRRRRARPASIRSWSSTAPGRTAARSSPSLSREGRIGKASSCRPAIVFVTGAGSATTYPDYKPAPFIVSSASIAGVDMVTVVTEAIFSLLRRPDVKIDTDRHVGAERQLVRAAGEAGRPRHHRAVRLADALVGRRATTSPAAPSTEGLWRRCETLLALCSEGDAVELTVDQGCRSSSSRPGKPPTI